MGLFSRSAEGEVMKDDMTYCASMDCPDRSSCLRGQEFEREIDDDGNVCAWHVEPSIDGIADIIARNIDVKEQPKENQ